MAAAAIQTGGSLDEGEERRRSSPVSCVPSPARSSISIYFAVFPYCMQTMLYRGLCTTIEVVLELWVLRLPCLVGASLSHACSREGAQADSPLVESATANSTTPR
ncbi:hypothetical protein [Oryza sativa Japonica Group]|uniref:Uncharacterized protein P0025A05.1 n=1 Tax=Oryza sativa subsp. japonica TaxID=39947 RepID=Q5ZAF6_ORYSJ|nr:hypothetical protein [Oryza sativa Japonica Group]